MTQPISSRRPIKRAPSRVLSGCRAVGEHPLLTRFWAGRICNFASKFKFSSSRATLWEAGNFSLLRLTGNANYLNGDGFVSDKALAAGMFGQNRRLAAHTTKHPAIYGDFCSDLAQARQAMLGPVNLRKRQE